MDITDDPEMDRIRLEAVKRFYEAAGHDRTTTELQSLAAWLQEDRRHLVAFREIGEALEYFNLNPDFLDKVLLFMVAPENKTFH